MLRPFGLELLVFIERECRLRRPGTYPKPYGATDPQPNQIQTFPEMAEELLAPKSPELPKVGTAKNHDPPPIILHTGIQVYRK